MLVVGSVLERLSLIALSAEEYATALNFWSQAGVAGGTMYDALLASCALKAEAKAICSWNLRHYRGFGAVVESRLHQPPSSPA